ncbi:class II aldolase and Adducin N-terminal domain-containing protein [Penicillium cosmopolitanum]|uniref:Class II aldolase and Adducin N-terminal domain-containing protein n=1 Tax=Penicillium cosmopolitanum TaxID=1131564 RepID=A0A9W9SDJ1_9EURO|nr:class II aldolase and Adducin N-terminal domain-containing protein [Penicillium cosmopolitanum]KAJ5376638.1 class II aldolase and Adducin N-terminal domain-containing protein [Penicillium cosmopolitanum]
MAAQNSDTYPTMSMSDTQTALDSIYRTLISGCHILHYHRILDAYGHLSVRHPTRSDVFLMPKNMAPATVSSPADIVQYHVEDASPVISSSPPGYVERFIHSAIYKNYPEVQSVVHSHSPEVLPYTITGSSVPTFDIANFYHEGDIQDLLVRNGRLGENLSGYFSTDSTQCLQPVVLMRGHGFTAVGKGIEESIFRAIYTAQNASTQTTALALSSSAGVRKNGVASELHYLNQSEISPTTEMTEWSFMRPWRLWVREVDAEGLYVNLA